MISWVRSARGWLAIATLSAMTGCDDPQIHYRDGSAGEDSSEASSDGITPGCDGADCQNIPAPRLVSPDSTAVITGSRPVLRVELAAGTDGTSIDVCRDRDCLMIESTLESTSNTVPLDHDLPVGVYFWRARGRRSGTSGTTNSSTWEFAIRSRGANPVAIGHIVDVDGNGFADPVVGAPAARAGQGQVFVYAGSSTAIMMAPASSPFATDVDVNQFGGAVAAGADLNGDGFGDLIVGAPASASGAGRVYLYFGGSSGIGMMPNVVINAPSGGGFGTAVGAADLNADGYGDVVVGAPSAGGAGAVYVFNGGSSGPGSSMPNATIMGTDGAGHFGSALGVGADVDGDGIGDLLIGAQQVSSGAGAVSVFLGGSMGINTTAATRLAAPDGAGSGFGASLSAVGDLNADGRADIAVGAPLALSGRGRVYVFPGIPTFGVTASPLSTLDDGTDGGGFGGSVAGGDVNGDGFADVVVGASGAAASAGRVYVFAGASTGVANVPTSVLSGTAGAAEQFGAMVSGGADTNGDGRTDIFVGAPAAQSSAGRAYLYIGQMGAIAAPNLTLSGPSAGIHFGGAVALGN